MNTVDTNAEESVVAKPVNVTTLTDPRFLTLTKYPANQVAFRVVRSDTPTAGVTEEVATHEPPRIRRVRSVRRSSLLCIEYPSTSTQEAIEADAKVMGLEGYTLCQNEDGEFMLLRSDLQAPPTDGIKINLGEQRTATIARSDITVPVVEAEGPNGITLVAIEFKKEQFPDTDAVLSYLERSDIDFIEEGIDSTEDAILVKRSAEVPEGAEVRTMVLETGVIASVMRSSMNDVSGEPQFTSVIAETAYGQWGWGQLDFNAGLADVNYTQSGRRATEMLNEVLNDILFFSSLPVTVRKELVVRAVNQFAVYMVSLLEALPEKLVIVNRSSTLEKDMSEKENAAKAAAAKAATAAAEEKEVQRSEGAAADPATETTTATTEAPITRSELQEVVAAAVAAAMAVKGESVARTDEATSAAAKETAHETPATQEAQVVTAVEQVIQRSMSGLEGALTDLATRMTAIESATIVRSDAVDPASQAAAKPSTFSGIFGNIRSVK